MKLFALSIASPSKVRLAVAPITARPSPSRRILLGLVEEAAALEQPRALLGRDLDVARRQKKDLVGDTLHSAVECVGQAAREVDQSLREILVGTLEVEDHRHSLLEAVGDLLCVVEAPRQ